MDAKNVDRSSHQIRITIMRAEHLKQGASGVSGRDAVRAWAGDESEPLMGNGRVLGQQNQWLIWTASFGVWTVLAFLASVWIYQYDRSTGSQTTFLGELPAQFSDLLTYAPLTPFVFALALRPRNHWFGYLLTLLLGGFAFTLLHVTLRGLIYPVWESKANGFVSAIWDSQAHAFTVRWYLFRKLLIIDWFNDMIGTYVPIVGFAFAISYYQRFRERELRTSQLEAQLTRAHLQALKERLQPHFLFNTLHSISALMLTDVLAADRMMTLLGDLLRMNLEADESQETTLSRELEFVNAYLEIEGVRFGDRLVSSFRVPDDLLDAEVPHLLLQPIVENAIKHGISKCAGKGSVCITTAREGSWLQIRVVNTGPQLPDTAVFFTNLGIGLHATRERLEKLYDQNQRIDVHPREEGGAEVSIRIPFRLRARPIAYDVPLETSLGRTGGQI
jgi:two-component system, LytTR family, sensor kinase